MSAPGEHIEESLKFEAEPEIELFKLVLRGGSIFYFRNGATVTWQGDEWEQCPCQLSGEEPASGDQDNRPTFVVFNNENLFGPIAMTGAFDLAILYRYKVLQNNLNDDINVYERKLWLVSPRSVSNRYMSCELRSPLDVPNIRTPNRIYAPPEFPVVSL